MSVFVIFYIAMIVLTFGVLYTMIISEIDVKEYNEYVEDSKLIYWIVIIVASIFWVISMPYMFYNTFKKS